MRKTISIVIPLFNEEKNINPIYRAVKAVLDTLPRYAHEIIFVDDGSGDGSREEIQTICESDAAVRLIEFTRNFGKEAATTAGTRSAVGDAVITLDADLQHPPELIPKFIKHWEDGAEIVVGVRSRNTDEGLVKRYGSLLFYALMNRMSETEMTPGETDFRLIDRIVADEFNKLSEHGRMTRLLINWLGYRKATVSFIAHARLNGEAQYSPAKLFKLALNSFAANSLFPLRAAGYLGLFITGVSFVLGLVVFIERYLFNDVFNWSVSGSAQLSIINAFLIGVVLMALGIMALYIGRISDESSRRPLYVVRKSKV